MLSLKDNTINIPSQTIGTAVYEGSMTLNNNELELEIEVDLDNDRSVCSGVATKG